MATVSSLKDSIKACQPAPQQPTVAPNSVDDECIVSYVTENGVEIKLTPSIVRHELITGDGEPTAQEVMRFIRLCESNRLNPYIQEAYLIRWASSKKAKIFCGKDVFFKRADMYPDYDGMEAGLFVVPHGGGGYIERPDSFYLVENAGDGGDRIVGAYAKVYHKNRSHPTYAAVTFKQYAYFYETQTNIFKIKKTWEMMPGTMIIKVAKVRALREAFPNMFSGMYIAEELSDAEEHQDTANAPEPKEKNELPASYKEEFATLEQRKMISDAFSGNTTLCAKFIKSLGYKKSSEIKAPDFPEVLKKAQEAALSKAV